MNLPDREPLPPVYGEKARNALLGPAPSKKPGLFGLGLCMLLAAGLCPVALPGGSLGLTTFTESSAIKHYKFANTIFLNPLTLSLNIQLVGLMIMSHCLVAVG